MCEAFVLDDAAILLRAVAHVDHPCQSVQEHLGTVPVEYRLNPAEVGCVIGLFARDNVEQVENCYHAWSPAIVLLR